MPRGVRLRNIALIGDIVLIAAFTLIGVTNHKESVSVLTFFRNFLPFTVAWLVIGSLGSAFALGTIRSFRKTYQRIPITLVISGAAAVILRDVLFNRPFEIDFALVAIAVTTFMISVWRLILAAIPGR